MRESSWRFQLAVGAAVVLAAGGVARCQAVPGHSADRVQSCTTNAAKGTCGPYGYPPITGTTDAGPTVGQDVWNPISGWQQRLHATSPGNWYVTANMPAGNTAVVSMPGITANYGQVTNTPTPLSQYSSIHSSFSESMPRSAGVIAEAAYDIWLGNQGTSDWHYEVMIQHDMSAGRDRVSPVATATFGGAGGIPAQTWNLGVYGSELIWQLPRGANVQSGSVDILAMLNWLVHHGYLPPDAGLWQIDYGFELCSTGGAGEAFKVSRYSLTPIRVSTGQPGSLRRASSLREPARLGPAQPHSTAIGRTVAGLNASQPILAWKASL